MSRVFRSINEFRKYYFPKEYHKKRLKKQILELKPDELAKVWVDELFEKLKNVMMS